MNTRRIVLASTSPYRRALLERLGVPFDVAAPDVDEDLYKGRDLAPEALVRTLAWAKARAVADKEPDALVIGSDQAVAIDDDVLGKPGTAERAVEQLLRLSGRTHRLLTAVALIDSATGAEQVKVDTHTMKMRPLDRAQVEAYVAIDAPLGCAGSYMFERAGIALFDRAHGQDATAIVGLPLMMLTRMLVRAGCDPLDVHPDSSTGR